MMNIRLDGKRIVVRIVEGLALEVTDRDGNVLWRSSRERLPTVLLGNGQAVPLHEAGHCDAGPYEKDACRGHKLRLSGLVGSDAVIELVLALDADRDDLLIQVEQTGGEPVVDVRHLYRLEKPVSDGGCLVIPQGSGYLVPADCPDELPGSAHCNFMIGGQWSLPMFGMIAGNEALCLVVDTWWDCAVKACHTPGESSALDVGWAASLGKLDYARSQRILFASNMDHVGMAKHYRKEAGRQGLVRTLEEKIAATPVLRPYLDNVLIRWPAWNPENADAVLADLRRALDAGLGLNFFFSKWPSAGDNEAYTHSTADGGWQGYLRPDPVPGGWPALKAFHDKVRELGCLTHAFMCPRTQSPEGVEFDETRYPMEASGRRIENLSVHGMPELVTRGLDNARKHGLDFDLMYYDGYAAFHPLTEDFSPDHPCTRRQTYETQNAVLSETRRRGIIPAAEVARFWCMADCDYFFFTDWASERLTNVTSKGAPGPVGEPVPLFELVFHDCYAAGFSGGGYSQYMPGYDWWPQLPSRLYEMLFCSAPAYNWLPMPGADMPIPDWGSDRANARFEWLKRWNTWYRAIATSEMTGHEFLSADRKQQRITFANGVSADLDMATGKCRVAGVDGFSGDWEMPAGDIGPYPYETDETDPDGFLWQTGEEGSAEE